MSDLYVGKHLLQLPVQLAELEGVSAVQLGGPVQLGVTLCGGVAPKLPDSRLPAVGWNVPAWRKDNCSYT